MSLPDSAPEELKILEQLQEACLQKMRSNRPLDEQKAALKDYKEIQRLKRTYMDAWHKQTSEDLKNASDELGRQAARFGLTWPR